MKHKYLTPEQRAEIIDKMCWMISRAKGSAPSVLALLNSGCIGWVHMSDDKLLKEFKARIYIHVHDTELADDYYALHDELRAHIECQKMLMGEENEEE